MEDIIDQIVGVGIAAHEGQLFAPLNQVLGVLTALGLITLCVSAFVMWRRRAPEGVLGAPPRGDVTIVMAKQLIAAKLAVAGGNSCPLTTNAEAWLCSHGGIGASIKQWDGGEELKNALDQFNNGGACTL